MMRSMSIPSKFATVFSFVRTPDFFIFAPQMRKIVFILFLCLAGSLLNAQCLQVESILVDACVPGGGCTNSQSPNCSCEGKNEMVLFKVGNIAISTNSLTVTWPNNTFRGWNQNLATANIVSTLNATIFSCGYLKEPVGGTLPANSEVLIISSWDMCTGANSFANLQDTLVVLFQDTGNYQGHFANHNNGGTVSSTPTGTVALRTLTLNYAPLSCAESVTYDRSLLVNSLGSYGGSGGQNDGSTVQFDAAGNPTYVNYGCQAPYTPVVVNAGANAIICYNDTIALLGNASGPYTSLAWSGGSGTFSTGTSLSTNYIPGSGDNGTITLYLTALGKCQGGVKDSMQLTITPAPSPTITANGNSVCLGSSFVLSVNQQGTATYTWNPGNAGGTSYTVSPTAQTVYTLDASNNCGNASTTFTVNVNSLPVISAVNDSVCKGNPGTVVANGASTYTWNTGASGSSLNTSPSSTTQYTVIGADANGCLDTTVAEIFVYNLPNVTANSASICPGKFTVLTAAGAITYTWSTFQTSASINVSPSVQTTYTVAGTDINGCSDTAVATVYVHPLPSVSSNNTSICPGGTAILNASGALTYTWNTSQTGSSISVSPSSATGYTVIGTDANGCNNFSVSNVSIYALPTITVNSPSTCPGTNTTLTASGASTYSWSTAQSGTSITVPGVATSYTVAGTDANGCVNAAIATVSLLPLPVAQAVAGDTIICVYQSGTLSVNAGPYTYSWSGPGGNLGNGLSVSTTQAGVYTLTASNSCGSAITQFTVAMSSPQAGFGSSPITANAPATFTFTNSSSGTALTNYWDLANGNSSTQPNPTTTYTVEGWYTISLIVTDQYGCKDTATINLLVTDTLLPVIVPNVFTPNGDQINDVFFVEGKDLVSLHCAIYDRWGLKLYEWNDPKDGWNGKNAATGQSVSDGTYYYILTYTDRKGKMTSGTGFLELIK